MKKIPTLIKQLQHNEEAKALKQAKDDPNNKQNRRRTIYFSIVLDILTSGLNRCMLSSKLSKTNSTSNG